MKHLYRFLVPLLLFSACKQHGLPSLPGADGRPVLVTIDQNQPGYTINPAFEGLSFETAILTKDTSYLNSNNKVLIQLIKNLGPGLLRIGGNSVEEIAWSGGTTATGKLPDTLLTKADINRLASFAGTSGWPVLFGLNLVNKRISATANEAKYIQKTLGNNLYAFHVGNEPDTYSRYCRPINYGYSDFYKEWKTCINAVKTQAPDVAFVGPGISFNSEWLKSFAATETANVKLLDAHFYSASMFPRKPVTYSTLLAWNGILPTFLESMKNASTKAHLPFRITQCNSIPGGGRAGVSDVFAASLWALDFMWNVAESNGQGVNFHGGPGLIHSPIAVDNGKVTSRPVYYGMLAFKYGSKGGKAIPTNIDHVEYNCSAHTSLNSDKSISVTLINKEETKNLAFTIKSGKKVSSVKVTRLSAPALTSKTGITFGGTAVNKDGTFKPGVVEQYAVDEDGVVINVPPGSAVVVEMK